MKISYNSELEKIDTQEKAYVLGLYYADGYVIYDKERSCYFSGIGLKNTDEELLNSIQSKLPIFLIQSTRNNMLVLRLNKKKACEDLMKNGVFLSKSGKNKDKVVFPNISPSLYSHFIRGFFDGDGSIFFSLGGNNNSKGFSFVSNNYFLVKKIQQILYYEGIPMKFSYKRGGHSIIRGKTIIFKTLTFQLECRNAAIIKLASKYLYKDAILYMKRKYEKMNKWFYREKDLCPRCGSDNTVYMDKHSSPRRVKCYKCNRISSVGKIYHDNIKPKKCKYCGSSNIVGNGFTKSRIDRRPVSKCFLCRNCNKNLYVKI